MIVIEPKWFGLTNCNLWRFVLLMLISKLPIVDKYHSTWPNILHKMGMCKETGSPVVTIGVNTKMVSWRGWFCGIPISGNLHYWIQILHHNSIQLEKPSSDIQFHILDDNWLGFNLCPIIGDQSTTIPIHRFNTGFHGLQ